MEKWIVRNCGKKRNHVYFEYWVKTERFKPFLKFRLLFTSYKWTHYIEALFFSQNFIVGSNLANKLYVLWIFILLREARRFTSFRERKAYFINFFFFQKEKLSFLKILYKRMRKLSVFSCWYKHYCIARMVIEL